MNIYGSIIQGLKEAVEYEKERVSILTPLEKKAEDPTAKSQKQKFKLQKEVDKL